MKSKKHIKLFEEFNSEFPTSIEQPTGGIHILDGIYLSPDRIKRMCDKYGYYLNGDEGVKQAISRYKKTVEDIYKNGGLIYRIIFANKKEDINLDNLGAHWTIYGDKEHISNLEADLAEEMLEFANEEDDYENIMEFSFLITAETKSGNINVDAVDLWDFLNEAEVNINDAKYIKIKSIKKL